LILAAPHIVKFAYNLNFYFYLKLYLFVSILPSKELQLMRIQQDFVEDCKNNAEE